MNPLESLLRMECESRSSGPVAAYAAKDHLAAAYAVRRNIVRRIFEGQFPIEATIRRDEAVLTSLWSAE